MPAPSRTSLPERPAFQRALLRWYETHQRSLPWRKNGNPYRILVSEFMLQQTRVETVIPYYERFLKRFPSLRDLAKAPLQEVLKAWAGLGYYARARNLHEAAKAIVREWGGKIPRTKEELLLLPGFGPYTAGAVASLAFHQPVPALDGNAKRVLGRLFPEQCDFSRMSAKKQADEFLAGWIPPRRAADFNQALMDLGAMVCIPSSPRCTACPVFRFCATKGKIPKKKRVVRKVREEIWAVALVEKDGKFLLHRKEGRGLLSGLWQFPSVAVEKNQGKRGNSQDPGKLLEKYLREDFGLETRIKTSLPEQEHLFTHIHALMKPYLGSLAGTRPSFPNSGSLRWVGASAFSRYPISTAMCKIAALVGS
ncbi:MAG: A/G-specific adenine glycosylase [Syntrophaceae bacterium]|nr:A/G-specific adenine glycosylase [Syntrophaceae bacterium]